MSLGAVGETYTEPEDPVQKAEWLRQAGLVTTPEQNERRTHTPAKDRARGVDVPTDHLVGDPPTTREENERRTFTPARDAERRRLADEAASAASPPD